MCAENKNKIRSLHVPFHFLCPPPSLLFELHPSFPSSHLPHQAPPLPLSLLPLPLPAFLHRASSRSSSPSAGLLPPLDLPLSPPPSRILFLSLVAFLSSPFCSDSLFAVLSLASSRRLPTVEKRLSRIWMRRDTLQKREGVADAVRGRSSQGGRRETRTEKPTDHMKTKT
ncbi:hypothetical protein TGDOM2_400660, partial [Toxoplasma gondii GAB2-2007-GAL-DOM2]